MAGTDWAQSLPNVPKLKTTSDLYDDAERGTYAYNAAHKCLYFNKLNGAERGT
jgi:hypothetical protein